MRTFDDFVIEQENKQLKPNGFAILKPGFQKYKDEWLKLMKDCGWRILDKSASTLTYGQAKELYKMHKGKDFYEDLVKYMSSEPCLCCACYKDCDDPIKEMCEIKDIVRQNWGIDDMKNCMHSSDSIYNVGREANICIQTGDTAYL